jgi:hypothetical protein
MPIKSIIKNIDDPRIAPLGWIDAGKAFLYLFRRFGPPVYGSDGSKEICDYVIETEVKDVFLIIHIGGKKGYISWSATKKIRRRYDSDWMKAKNKRTEFMKSIEDSLENCLRDLLRPVSVRDNLITLLGEDTNELAIVEPYKAAGWGIVTEVYEAPDLYFDFIDYVKGIGNGSVVSGMRKIMDNKKEVMPKAL